MKRKTRKEKEGKDQEASVGVHAGKKLHV